MLSGPGIPAAYKRAGPASGPGKRMTGGCRSALGLGALNGVRRGAVAHRDGDLARLALLRLGNADLEDAPIERGLDGAGVDALGEGQRAVERTGRALDAVVAVVALLVLAPALAGHSEHVVLELDVDVILGEPGQVGAKDEVVVGLDQVHRRNPAPEGIRRPVRRGVEECVEEPIDVRLQRAELARRPPATDRPRRPSYSADHVMTPL